MSNIKTLGRGRTDGMPDHIGAFAAATAPHRRPDGWQANRFETAAARSPIRLTTANWSIADSCAALNNPSLDHVVGAHEHRCRQLEPERLGGLQVNY
jgi:hypothetical protein